MAPPKTNLDHWKEMQNLVGPIRLAKMFDIPEANDADIYISAYKSSSTKTFTASFEEAQMTEKQREYFEAVKSYNKVHENQLKYLQMLIAKKKEQYSKYEEDLVFEVPIYTPFAGVQLGGQTGEHNRGGKPILWQDSSSGPWGIYISSKERFDNFSKWYYANPYSFSRSKGHVKCVMDMALSILLSIWGSDPSILKYDFVWPHLDWSHPWTDQEILKEIGLPEDFLTC